MYVYFYSFLIKKIVKRTPKSPAAKKFGQVSARNRHITQKHIDELRDNGFTIVENVLSAGECAAGCEEFYTWIDNLGTGVTRDNFHLSENKDLFIANKHGIGEYPPTGQAEPSLYIRTRSGVSTVFGELWGVEQKDLVVSMDRFQIGLPKKDKKKSKRGIPDWAHADQDSRLIGLQCIQGFITLKDVSEEDGGSLFVLKGSHKLQKEIFAKMEELKLKHNENNWVKLPEQLDDWLIKENDCKPMTLKPLNKGSMLLWDSRTIHANVPPKNGEVRLGSYVCMLPRLWVENAPRKQLERRRQAFLDARTTSHWPSVTKLFSDAKPFRCAIPDTTISKYNTDYTNSGKRAKRAIAFLERQFGNDPTEYERVVRQIGFTSLAQYKNSINK